MKNKNVDPIDQIEGVRNMFKEFKESIDKDMDIPQSLFFFNSKNAEPLAYINLPPFKQEHKPEVFRMAFGCLRYFQTDRIVMTSDVWYNVEMKPKEMDDWYKQGKSLSEHPLSQQALMVTCHMANGSGITVVDEYGIDDFGNLTFRNDVPEYKQDNLGGLISDTAKEAYRLLYNENDVVDSESANKYFGLISSLGFDINMSDMMFDSLGLAEIKDTDE